MINHISGGNIKMSALNFMNGEGVYFGSWGSRYSNTADTCDLALVDCLCVFLCFVSPDANYTSGSFNGTGLQFSSDFGVIRSAIAKLRQKSKVYLSIGGGSYQNWAKRNVDSWIKLANDLGVDGLDIDWEKTNKDQQELIQVLKEVNAKRGKLLLSAAVWSTGAFPKDGGDYTGLWIEPLKQCTFLDQVNVMSYDAGRGYDPIAAAKAYRALFSGKILMGFEVGTPGWDPDMNNPLILNEDAVKKTMNFIKTDSKMGWFVWEYFKQGDPDFQKVKSLARSILTVAAPAPAPAASSSATINCPYCKTLCKVSLLQL